MRGVLRDESGSSVVEFVLVGVLLTALTLGVLQLAVAVYVRNLVHDAAVEGAYHAGLADVTPGEGAARTVAIIDRTIGAGFVESVTARETDALGDPAIEVTVVATLPLIGLFGIPHGWEVTAHAPRERLE